MLELLRSLEWAGGSDADGWCPTCGGAGRHEPDCRLDRAIRELTEGRPCRSFTDTGAGWVEGPDTREYDPGSGTLVEPTVDEMARQVDATLAGKRVGPWLTPPAPKVYEASGPTFADKLRALGLPITTDEDGDYFQPDGVDLCRNSRGWTYTDDDRRWPTAEAAVDELYAEWVAKQGRLVIDPASPMLNEPPTDPSALAAWLYARVVPGRTVVEHGRAYKVPVETVTLRSADVLVETRHACITIPGGDFKHLRLLNPDGTVLWEAK